MVDQAGQPTVVHAYDPRFPRQLADVSYGLPDTGIVWEQLVAAGQGVAYHVPTAADAGLIPEPFIDAGWTGPTFDDSAWTDTIAIDPSGLLIAEAGVGEARFVEIQNAAASGIETAGWQVLVNDASAGIHAAHAESWALPAGEMAAGAILYGTDDAADAGADFHWSAPIAWSADDPGWVMIVDDGGVVMDFAAWGYGAAELASLDVSFGGFDGITVDGQWSGVGVNLSAGATPGAQEDVIAFGSTWEYMHPLDGTDPAGTDPDFNATWMTPAEYDGPAFDHAGAAMLGYGAIDLRPVATNITAPSGGDRYTAYFRTELALTADMVETGIEILSDDGAVIYIDGSEVARSNFSAAKSDVYTAFADDYRYSDGVRTEDRTETLAIADLPAGTHTIAVSVHQSSASSSDLGFDLRLFGRPAGGGEGLRRTGDIDGDTAADFAATDELTPGGQNPGLTVPFGTVAPTQTGVGFSAGQPEFDQVIQTDVAGDMHGVNASLWTRIEFQVDAPTLFDTLTLHMKYDDGFAAYVNGHEVARRNAPGTLAYDSAATDARDDARAVVFEDIDITAHLFGAIQSGANVLAIHALNVSAADADLLVLPELTAMSSLERPQYMTVPTPRQANVPGALGLVADVRVSVERGFFTDEFDVAITTDTPGAEIRYTLDGSKPSETVGTPYTDPVAVATTATLRAIAYKTGHIPTGVATHTYIFPRDVVEQDGEGFPAEWGYDGGPDGADYGIDPEIVGTHADPNEDYYDDFLDGLTSIPTLSLVLPVGEMFSNGGLYDNPNSTSMEKETSAELIYPDGRIGFQIDAGLKMQGGASRNTGNSPKHSMSLRFRTQYGPGHLEFPLFAGSPVDTFNSLQLRAVYNNSWIHWGSDQRDRGSLMRDQWIRDSLIAMGQVDAGQGQHVHLYIDGLYWGIHILQERQEASHYAAYHGGDDDRLDAMNSGSAIDGTTASWTGLQDLVASAAADGISLAEFEQIQQKLDVVNLIDYMIVNHFGGNTDWDQHNWRAAGGGLDDAPWRVYSWDAERVIEIIDANTIGVNNAGAPSRLFQHLRQSDEFVLMFADRLHKHFYNGGALTADSAATRWSDRAEPLDDAMVCESARWGDYRRDVHSRSDGPYELYTRNDHWRPQLQWLMDHYFHQIDPPYRSRSDEVLIDYEGAGLYPDTEAPVFNINGTYQHGGVIDSGDRLSALNPNGAGTIWYTLDGSDPRLPGGAINTASAVAYAGDVAIEDSVPVLARVLDDAGRWSALNEAIYQTSLPPEIAIAEINYHPSDPTAAEDSAGYEDPSAFEFIELKNVGSRTVGLQTVHFAEGITFTFTGGGVTSLAPGEYAVVVRDPAAFAQRYGTGVNVAGQFTGALDSDGETLALAHGADSVIVGFTFNDSGDWPGRADGKGATLEIIDPAGDYSDPANWRSSVAYGGTPGAAPSPDLGVVINEVLTHTDLPEIDTVELHNTTGADINIGGWYLSDSWGSASSAGNGNYKKFRIPDGKIIPAGRYVTFDEDDFNPSGGVDPDDFALSGSYGDDVWLMKADPAGKLTHFVDHAEFGAVANGESFGRWPDGSGDLYPMNATSLGQPNPGPRVGPVVLSELRYQAGIDAELDDLEFIEIYNASDETVDLTGWRLRKGVDFDFPAGAAVDPLGLLVVLAFDPADPGNAPLLADFHAEYDVKPWVPLVGPYQPDPGAANPDRIQLLRPDEPPAEDPGFIPYLLEDEIDLDGASPLPAPAGENGDSLHRLGPQRWGNDPASWAVALPTPTTIPTGQMLLTDSSADPADAAVQFTTALSAFRTGADDSTLIRPACPDTRQYVDVTNTGRWPLTIFEVRTAAPDVTVDGPLTADVVLQVGQTQRFVLTYDPSLPTVQDATTQDFDLAAGLVILTSDPAAPAVDVRLRGASTFTSDINYDGVVNLGELGILNVNFSKVAADPGFDPTADINGDGVINLGDLGALNAELGRQIASTSASLSSAPAASASAATPAAAPADLPAATAATQDQTPAYYAYSSVTAPVAPAESTVAEPVTADVDATRPEQDPVPVTTVAIDETTSPVVLGEPVPATSSADDFPVLLTDELDYASKLTDKP